MGACRDCKFWGGRYHYLGYEMETETLQGPKSDWDGKKSCRLMTTDDDGNQGGSYGPDGHHCDRPAADKPSLALAYGDRGGVVITQPDFGCVQWEPKP